MNKFAIQDNTNYTSPVRIDKKTKAVLKDLNVGALTREAAMAALGVAQATLYRRKKALGITRPPGIRKRQIAAAKATKDARETTAQMVINGRITFEEGLAILNVHRTSLWRIINRIKASAE